MKKILLSLVAMVAIVTSGSATDRGNRISLSTSLIYERGWDATLSAEHETRHHNAWEYFVNAYLKWEECPSCGHICPESFWHGYNTWQVGIAYKPAVYRSRNTTGNLRLGGSIGSDRDKVIGGVHVGYEHDYNLRHGETLFWQVKEDLVINGQDLFRTGFAIGLKIPIR